MKNLMIAALLLFSLMTKAQVKIGNNPNTIDPNSLLELESTNKGFLPPRVALNSISSVSPLTGTVPAGMLVFSSGGTLSDGYYYWDGTEWKFLSNGNLNTSVRTADATLAKTEKFVLASNDITLTLPVVTSADNGLSITIKNVGTYTDLVTVQGNSGATIDNQSNTTLTRWVGKTFVANGGNWLVKEKKANSTNLFDVGPNSSWTSLSEVIAFLNSHMSGPAVIRLDQETYDITLTITINLPYPLTIEGTSYGTSTIAAASGLSGQPMFRCLTESYFKMLSFDGTSLAGYGSNAGEDGIRFVGSGTYHEVKDCTFDHFYNTILDSSDAELWIFECDIDDAQNNGIIIHSPVPGTTVKVAETDFISCVRGVNFDKGSGATIQLASGGYYNANSTDSAIVCHAATFTSYNSISIKGNLWNNIGHYVEGFDFTRTDGRDANVILESNAGMGDQKPNCFINVINSVTTKTLTTASTWYKADWGTNTSSQTVKWTIADNKITYQPTNKRDAVINVSGDLSVNSSNQNISFGIVKNGNTAVRYGETTLRLTAANQPFQFSFNAFLTDIAPGDYFEIYYSNATSSGKVITISDIQWFTNSQ